jgi:hypothetical protein
VQLLPSGIAECENQKSAPGKSNLLDSTSQNIIDQSIQRSSKHDSTTTTADSRRRFNPKLHP